MALDALETEYVTTDGVRYRDENNVQSAITALREALAQPEPEPVAWIYDNTPYGVNVTTENREHDPDYFPLYLAPSAPAPEVPAGWELVPIEPTDGMIIAAEITRESGEDNACSIYKAMLAAAPEYKDT